MKIANKKRKQVSVEFLEHIKNTVNDMLLIRIP